MAANSPSILKDFRHNFFVVTILCIGMIPLWGKGYLGYLDILLLPVLIFTAYDSVSIAVIVFSLAYTLSLQVNGAVLTPSAKIFNLLYPIIFYQAGIFVGKKFKLPRSGIYLIVLMTILLGLPAIIANVHDAVSTGVMINPLRSVSFDENDAMRSATNYGMMLSLLCGSLGVILLRAKQSYDQIAKILVIAGAVGALFGTVHLVNRTGILLALISCVLAVVQPPIRVKDLLHLALTAVVIYLVFSVFFEDSKFLFDAILSYNNRDTGISSIDTAGGRDELWIGGLLQIFQTPEGNPNGLVGYRNVYAHNMIIDGGVKGGIVCFILLLFIFVQFVISVVKTRAVKCFSEFERKYLVLLGATFCLQSMVEPVLDGVPSFFWFMLFFMGYLRRMISKAGSLIGN